MKPSILTRIYAAMACLRGDIQCSRNVLPWKRESETIKFELNGFTYYTTNSRYEDGRLAEVFISTAKTGELLRGINRDSAVAVSIALQYGAPVEVLRQGMGRSDDAGRPDSPIAAALDIATGRKVAP